MSIDKSKKIVHTAAKIGDYLKCLLLLEMQLNMFEFKCLSLLDMRLTKDRVQIFEASVERLELLSFSGGTMDVGHFYFLSEEYYKDFSDPYLMQNHETIDGVAHDRPCFYAFQESDNGIFWLVPLSSQVDKYQKLYDSKVAKFGKCDTIHFGNVLGHKKAFLIQNICPITEKYIASEYIDSKAMVPVKLDGILEKELITKAKKVLALQRKGVKLVFPDIASIELQLLSK